ncbi:TetR/AcrR family transcriptional regulator [Paenibacillus sp. MB22_1]|uniref:TetR/AcrR family transcriptional regulator n=1 Tax=Paenibacillus sp. MB22_1 TaxID=3383121 RepID=UPI0039A174EB
MTLPHKKALGRPVQQPDALATSEQILRSASLLFMEKGYKSVSMNQVAEHCGITKATVYYPEFRKRIRSMQDAEAMTTCDVKMQEFSMPNGDGSL